MDRLGERVKLEYRQAIAVVSLERPEKYNGLDLAMMQALDKAAKILRKRRAVVFRGAGPAFCAGLDFATPRQAGRRLPVLVAQGQPVSAPVPGLARSGRAGHCRSTTASASAAGLQLALGCGFRISSPDCQFSIMEIQWSLIPDMGASVTLRELLPTDQALELTLTGREFDAQEALDKQLITRIDDDPLHAALTLAETIAAHSPDAVAAAKRLFRTTRVASERRALRRERWLQFKLLLGSNQREAMKARMEKREAKFKDR